MDPCQFSHHLSRDNEGESVSMDIIRGGTIEKGDKQYNGDFVY